MSQGTSFFGKSPFSLWGIFLIVVSVPWREVFSDCLCSCSFPVIFCFWLSGCQNLPRAILVGLVVWIPCCELRICGCAHYRTLWCPASRVSVCSQLLVLRELACYYLNLELPCQSGNGGMNLRLAHRFRSGIILGFEVSVVTAASLSFPGLLTQAAVLCGFCTFSGQMRACGLGSAPTLPPGTAWVVSSVFVWP